MLYKLVRPDERLEHGHHGPNCHAVFEEYISFYHDYHPLDMVSPYLIHLQMHQISWSGCSLLVFASPSGFNYKRQNAHGLLLKITSIRLHCIAISGFPVHHRSTGTSMVEGESSHAFLVERW